MSNHPSLFIGGPKDGHRIAIPRDHECSRTWAGTPGPGMHTVLYMRLDLGGGHHVFYLESMMPDEVMRALIDRYPTPNPKP